MSLKAVFDTNIFISAFVIPGGKAEEAFLYAIQRNFTLFSSVFILTETANKLRTKFRWSDEKIRHFLKSVSKTATVLKTRPHLHILKDEPDNRVLECALLADADMLVTGDHHLLELKHHEGISIVKLADFVERLRQP